jgi:hypothetical protein
VGCTSDGFACQCSNSAAIRATAAICVVRACKAEAVVVLDSAEAFCSCATAMPLEPCTSSGTSTSAAASPTTSSTLSTSIASRSSPKMAGLLTTPSTQDDDGPGNAPGNIGPYETGSSVSGGNGSSLVVQPYIKAVSTYVVGSTIVRLLPYTGGAEKFIAVMEVVGAAFLAVVVL